jgi:rubrerythrin
MEKLSQDYFLRFSFSNSIEKEEQLLKKYEDYYNIIKDKDLKEIIKEFMKTSSEHIELLKDKRLKINFEK